MLKAIETEYGGRLFRSRLERDLADAHARLAHYEARNGKEGAA